MAGRRVSLATLPGKPFNPAADTEPATPAAAAAAAPERGHRAASVPLAAIVFNPLNPRRTFVEETLAELADSLRTHGQISPITVVSRAAFLAAHPGQEAALGEAEFVALEGNRRLHAAHRAGLEQLRVDLNDDLAATAADMLQSALAANTHREPVPELEEARAIQELLDTRYDGNQAAVARALSKTPAWVGQRLALLHLAPEVRELVESRELTVKAARQIGAAARRGDLAPEEQLAAAQEAMAKPADAGRVNPVYPQAADKGPGTPADRPGINPVYSPPDQAPSAEASPSGPAEAGTINPVYSGPADQVPEQRAAAPVGVQPDAVILHLNPQDIPAAAAAIRGAFDLRQSARLAEALIDLLRGEPEYARTD